MSAAAHKHCLLSLLIREAKILSVLISTALLMSRLLSLLKSSGPGPSSDSCLLTRGKLAASGGRDSVLSAQRHVLPDADAVESLNRGTRRHGGAGIRTYCHRNPKQRKYCGPSWRPGGAWPPAALAQLALLRRSEKFEPFISRAAYEHACSACSKHVAVVSELLISRVAYEHACSACSNR